ncbi:hypothetical protein B0H17DRAFT_1132023 [Mycena rosella]|uniref:Uncharacterized protein n=1 Tax=Mycena rosella TaxID=1033263 RepID=A0AAD7DMY3_MYCRO|nr:hypothetical protein B0H17DRAFT_1132023 [Mycena rosella]
MGGWRYANERMPSATGRNVYKLLGDDCYRKNVTRKPALAWTKQWMKMRGEGRVHQLPKEGMWGHTDRLLVPISRRPAVLTIMRERAQRLMAGSGDKLLLPPFPDHQYKNRHTALERALVIVPLPTPGMGKQKAKKTVDSPPGISRGKSLAQIESHRRASAAYDSRYHTEVKERKHLQIATRRAEAKLKKSKWDPPKRMPLDPSVQDTTDSAGNIAASTPETTAHVTDRQSIDVAFTASLNSAEQLALATLATMAGGESGPAELDAELGVLDIGRGLSVYRLPRAIGTVLLMESERAMIWSERSPLEVPPYVPMTLAAYESVRSWTSSVVADNKWDCATAEAMAELAKIRSRIIYRGPLGPYDTTS